MFVTFKSTLYLSTIIKLAKYYDVIQCHMKTSLCILAQAIKRDYGTNVILLSNHNTYSVF